MRRSQGALVALAITTLVLLPDTALAGRMLPRFQDLTAMATLKTVAPAGLSVALVALFLRRKLLFACSAITTVVGLLPLHVEYVRDALLCSARQASIFYTGDGDGPEGEYYCAPRAEDAGKSCSGASDCSGICRLGCLDRACDKGETAHYLCSEWSKPAIYYLWSLQFKPESVDFDAYDFDKCYVVATECRYVLQFPLFLQNEAQCWQSKLGRYCVPYSGG